MDAELQRFVQNLDVPIPTAMPTLTQRLSAVLMALTTRARPALLIFDTFESAGDAADWVKDHLLVPLIRAPWLRLVIAGQRVPELEGAPWYAEACPTIALSTPEPEHWLAYGQRYKPSVTIEFVCQAHHYCGGKPSVLAQLLGSSS